MSTSLQARIGALVIIAVGLFAPRILAHEGHDHDAAPPPVPVQAAPRAEASTDEFELVAVLRGAELVLHLDRFRTNEPVLGATLEIETPDGPKTAAAVDDAYRLDAPWLAKPGRHELLVAVTTAEAADVLTATLVVPEPPAAAAAPGGGFMTALAADLRRIAGSGLAGRSGDAGPLAAIGAIGFLAGVVVTRLLRRRRVAAAVAMIALLPVAGALAHEGHDHGEPAAPPPTGLSSPQRLPDGTIFVPKPTQRILAIRTLFTEIATHPTAVELPGRVIPDPNASGLVQASVAGRLSPPPGGFPRLGAAVAAGDVLAYVTAPLTAAEISDQRQRQGELDQQIALAERRIVRLEALDRSRVVARAQLEDARLELAGLRDRRAALDQLRRAPEPLVAPVAGRIAAAHAVAGQIAETNAVVFQIVEPTRLWVEALSFAPLPAAPRNAAARDADGRVLALRHEGTGFADRNQAIAMHFAVVGDTTGLRPGQLVTVLVETQAAREGVVVPRISVLRGAGGQAIVYEHVAAERFVAREVRVVPLDGERVLVAAGLDRGRRVVTQGAELLNQIR